MASAFLKCDNENVYQNSPFCQQTMIFVAKSVAIKGNRYQDTEHRLGLRSKGTGF